MPIKKDFTPKIPGVYMIECLINGNVYVGSCVNLYRRKISHFSLLRNNHHDNKDLQYDFNKYGVNCFLYCILEECDKSDLYKIEQYYMDLHRANLYNRTILSNSSKGIKYARESKLKMSKSKSGVNNPNYGIKKSDFTKNKIRQSLLNRFATINLDM